MKRIIVICLLLGFTFGYARADAQFNPELANQTTVARLMGEELEPQALQDDIKFYLDMIFGFLPTIQDSSTGLLTEITNVFNTILAGGGGTCPVVTVDPPISGLTLPETLTVVADYGAGCTASDGTTWAGSWKMNVTNIVQSLAGISADFTFTASDLSQNGVMLADGTFSGSIQLAAAGSDQQLTVNITTAGMKVSQYGTLSGSVNVVGVGQIGLGGATFDTVTVTPNNLTLAYNVLLLSGEYTLQSGTVQSVRQGSTENYDITANLRTSSGSIKGSALVQSPTGGQYIISTTGGGFSLHGYTVTADGVILEPAVCIYPRGGTLNVTKSGEQTGVGFSGACDGTYDFF